MCEQNNMLAEQRSPLAVYLQKRSSFIMRTGIFFLITALVLLIGVYLLIPRQKVSSLYCTILLDKDNGKFHYPSGSLFNSNDLISMVVLQKVYKDLHLQDKIKFSSFASALFISQDNLKAAALDALFKEKLSKKPISVVAIRRLEEEYAQKIKQAVLADIQLCMDSRVGLSDSDVSRILCTIPQTWFAIYSKLEARTFPELDNSGLIRQLNMDIKSGYYFIPLQKARQISQRLLKTCRKLHEMKQNRKITLDSGESLDDLVARINMLNDYRINSFALYIQNHKEYRGAMDYVFIVSSIQNLERSILTLKAKYEAAQQAKNLISVQLGSTGKTPKSEGSGTIIQLNNEFLDGLSALIRNDMNSKLLAEYAEKLLVLKDSLAEVESEKVYFEQMLSNKYQQTEAQYNIPKMPETLLKQEILRAFQELEALNKAVFAIKEKIAEEYLSSREFFSSMNIVRRYRSGNLQFVRLAGGIIFLFFAFALVFYGSDFYRMSKNGKLNS